MVGAGSEFDNVPKLRLRPLPAVYTFCVGVMANVVPLMLAVATSNWMRLKRPAGYAYPLTRTSGDVVPEDGVGRYICKTPFDGCQL